MTLIVFIIILSVLVLVHEFGHYIVAKKSGIRVEEFGLGLPPRLIGKQIGETLYSLNLLPFGGFVKLTGEDPEETKEGPVLTTDPRSFAAKTPLQRSLVLVAGVFMNTVLAVCLFYIVLISNNLKTSYIPLFFDYNFKFGDKKTMESVVTGMQAESPAELSGIELGESIIDIDGQKVTNVQDVRNVLKDKKGKEVVVRLANLKKVDSPVRSVTLTPTTDKDGNPILGVYLSKAVLIDYSRFPNNLFAGFLHSYNVMSYSASAFSYIIGLSVETKDISPISESISGPVGIYSIVGGVLEYGEGNVLINLLDFVALMSVSLAFINIMPFPALDGGRLVFVVYEGIFKRKINPDIELKLHKIGFAFLLGFIVLVTIKDIVFR